jgi:ketosteroid isomerase-like protein
VHPNERRVRDLYDAMGRGDVEAIFGMWAEDARMTIPGNSPLAGRFEGRPAIFEALGRAISASGGTFSLELVSALANDTYAVTLHRWTAERDGRRIEANNINIYRFDERGLISERSELLEDAAAHDAFWSQ